MKAQANGLAQALVSLAADEKNEAGSVAEGVVNPAAVVNLLPPAVAAALGLHGFVKIPSPPPQVVISCGSRAQAAALAVKRQTGCFAVCVQRPRANAAQFDAVVMPRHDAVANVADKKDERTVLTLGAVGAPSPAAIIARRARARERFAAYRPPFVAVLVGGDNRAYRLETARLLEQLWHVAAAAAATLLVTPSRRSGGGVVRALGDAFGGRHFVWNGGGDNPYADILAAADAFCVTADSVNMVSEACASGRGVYLLPLRRRGGFLAAAAAQKFARFHADVVNERRARWWTGEWAFFTAPPLAETARAATALWRLLRR